MILSPSNHNTSLKEPKMEGRKEDVRKESETIKDSAKDRNTKWKKESEKSQTQKREKDRKIQNKLNQQEVYQFRLLLQ